MVGSSPKGEIPTTCLTHYSCRVVQSSHALRQLQWLQLSFLPKHRLVYTSLLIQGEGVFTHYTSRILFYMKILNKTKNDFLQITDSSERGGISTRVPVLER